MGVTSEGRHVSCGRGLGTEVVLWVEPNSAQCTEGCAAGGHIQRTTGAAKAKRLGSTLERGQSPASPCFLFLNKRVYLAVNSTALPLEGFFG